MTSWSTRIVRSRSVPVAVSWFPSQRSSSPESTADGRAAPTDGPPGRGQRVHQGVALGPELHRALSFRSTTGPTMAHGER